MLLVSAFIRTFAAREKIPTSLANWIYFKYLLQVIDVSVAVMMIPSW